MILSHHYINSFLALVYNPFYKRTKTIEAILLAVNILERECVQLIPKKAGRTTSVSTRGDTPNLL